MYQKKSYGKCIADKLASCSLTFNGEEGAKICFYRQFVRGKFVKALAPGSSAREWNSAVLVHNVAAFSEFGGTVGGMLPCGCK